jgi:hypothetical protein
MVRIIMYALLCSVLALGQGKGKGKGKGNGGAGTAPASSSVTAQLSFGSDRQLIQDFCRTIAPANLPPGLAKRGGNLPPGLEKQLQRNGHLPPGLERQTSSFPPELERRLAPLPPEFTRAFVAGRAVILNKSTSLIVDIFIPF